MGRAGICRPVSFIWAWSGPKFFMAFAGTVAWSLKAAIVLILFHYLDDFLIFGRRGCNEGFHYRQIPFRWLRTSTFLWLDQNWRVLAHHPEEASTLPTCIRKDEKINAYNAPLVAN